MGLPQDMATLQGTRPSPPQQQSVPTQPPSSHPSQPSSPPLSLPPSLSRPHQHPQPQVIPQPMPSPGAQGPSPSHMYFPYLSASVDGPAQQLAQVQLPPHTTTPHPMLTVSPELTGWGARLTNSYHHPPSAQQPADPASLQLDALAVAPSRAFDSLAVMGAMDMMDETMGPITSANRRLPSEAITTHHFHSTLQPQRHSPQSMQRTQTLANDLSRDQTVMMLQQAHAPAADQRMLQYTQQQQTTNTAATLAPSLDGSPSWNSAMNPMTMSSDQYDPYFRYQQAQAQRQQQQHANAARHQPSRGPPPPDSSQAHHNSHSSTAISHQNRQQAQTTPPMGTSMATNNLTAAQAHRYSLELRRQQEEQLRKLHWQQEEEQRHQQQEQDREREREEYARDQARRRSEEEVYLQRLAQAYGNSASPHPLEAQHASQHLNQDGHPYYTAQQGYPVLGQAHLAALRADGDAEEYQRQQQQQMLDGAYHPVDAQDLLDLSQEVPGVLGVGALTGQSPEAVMIKYESPLPLE